MNQKGISMKKKLLILSIIIMIIIIPDYANAESSEVLEEQKETLGISDFLKETEKYKEDTIVEDMDLYELLNSELSGSIDNKTILEKILKAFGVELKSTIKTLITILVIVVIHSILKTISEDLQNGNIAQIIYYVQYILIITVVMSNFTEILSEIKETIDNLVGFMNILVPLLVTLMVYTGSITTSGVLEPIILFMINFIGNIIESLITPVVSIITVLVIVSKISDRVQIDKLSKFMKSSIVWFLGIILTVFVGVISLEGTLTSSVDGITAKTAKAAVSNVIPIVGKILGDAVETVIGCGILLKNATGFIGVIIILGICINPILKLLTLSIAYSIASSIIEPIADKKIVSLLEEIGGIFKLLLAILCSISVLLIIGVTLVIKITNSGAMYR